MPFCVKRQVRSRLVFLFVDSSSITGFMMEESFKSYEEMSWTLTVPFDLSFFIECVTMTVTLKTLCITKSRLFVKFMIAVT